MNSLVYKRMTQAALAAAGTVLWVSLASATAFNVRPSTIVGPMLQNYFNSIGQTINVDTAQMGNAVWTATVSGNSTFTIKLSNSGQAGTSIGVYNDGTPGTHFEIFPSNVAANWFAVASFDVQTPGHLVVNLFNDHAMWQKSTEYFGVNSKAFGFYISNPNINGPNNSFYSEDDENFYSAQNMVFAATGASVGSWWLSWETTLNATSDHSFADVVMFLESVNQSSPVQPTTWGNVKRQFLSR